MLRTVIGFILAFVISAIVSVAIVATFTLANSFVQWQTPEADMEQVRALVLWWVFVFGAMIYYRYK